MSWWRRHVVAVIVLPPLLVASVWVAAGEHIGAWMRLDPLVLPTGVQGVPQSVPAGSVTVHGVATQDADDPSLDTLDLGPGAEVLLVDVTVEVTGDAICSLHLEGSWHGARQEWSSSWSVGDYTYCGGSPSETGVVGFVVPEGVTDPVLVLEAGGDVTGVALER